MSDIKFKNREEEKKYVESKGFSVMRPCTSCGKVYDLLDFAYIGTVDPKNESCDPFTPLIYLCEICFEEKT